jgi:hypothetical protein
MIEGSIDGAAFNQTQILNNLQGQLDIKLTISNNLFRGISGGELLLGDNNLSINPIAPITTLCRSIIGVGS